MFEKDAEEYRKDLKSKFFLSEPQLDLACQGFKDGLRKANESHSPDEHIDKDRVVLGIIKHCNKTRYSLVQWNGVWWYQYGTFNAEVRLIAWYNIPELPKEQIK